MTDTADAKRLARAFYESYNQKDLVATFDAYISHDLENHVMGGAFDREGWLAFDASLFPAFEDFSLAVLDQVAEGDKVATRYQRGGRQTGEFAGVPARGNTAFLPATSVDRVENGLIVEHWTDLDFGGFLTQLSAGAQTPVQIAHDLADEYFRLANAHDLDGLVALHAPGFVSHDRDADTGIGEYRTLISRFFEAFPDSTFTPVNVVAEGDRLSLHLETTGTHRGEFSGFPATGRLVRFPDMDVRRIQNGKFAEHWSLLDKSLLLRQLQ
jgi:steroid delta-isomerase-like uncharacterized protein